MIGAISIAYMVIGIAAWLWSAQSFDDRSQALSVLPIVVMFWPLLAVAILVTYLFWEIWELRR